MKNRILYLIHVPWGWIKQRPHFIAEGLAHKFKVNVLYEMLYNNNKNLISNSHKGVKVNRIFKVPYSRIKGIRKFNILLTKFQLKYKLKRQRYIWLTHPGLYSYIKDILVQNQVVIYDCMDDHLEFDTVKKNAKLLNKLTILEKELCHKADIIICSSNYLKEKIISRYGILKRVDVINNAINIVPEHLREKAPEEIINRFRISDKTRIVYIGTISYWLDWKLIVESLNKFNEIEYYFIGPSEINIPQNDRIIHFPPVQHSVIYELMNLADILIMPFVVDELTKGVNPVKVYEYIYSGKPVIVKRYGETLPFLDYVHLYEKDNQFYSLLSDYLKGSLFPKKPANECIMYGQSNTWAERIKRIIELINSIQ